MESAAGVRGGWGEMSVLLLLFLLLPPTAVALVHYGQRRAGSIMLLSILPAASYAHMQFLLPLLSVSASNLTGNGQSAAFLVGYEVLIGVLALAGLFGMLLGLALLRESHRHAGHDPE